MAKIKITKRSIESMPVREKDHFVFDRNCRLRRARHAERQALLPRPSIVIMAAPGV